MLFVTIFLLVSMPLLCTQSHDLHTYLWANYAQFDGDYKTAHDRYQQLVDNNPSSYFCKGYIPFLFETQKFSDVVKLTNTIDTQFSNDPEIQQFLAIALQKVGRHKESDARFIKLSGTFKNDQAIAFQTANIYMRAKEPENAIATIDSLLNNSPKKPNNFIFHFLKSQIYVQLNQKEKALESVQATLAMQPHFDKGWLLLALLEEQLGHLTEAVKGYSTFLELTGKNQEIEQHLVQLMFKQKVLQQNSPQTAKTDFDKAVQHVERKEFAPALAAIDTHLALKPQDPEARLLKIQIMTAQGNYSKAAEHLKTWIMEEPSNDMWLKALHLLCSSGLQMHKAIAIIEDVHRAHPSILLPILYLADLNTRMHHHDTALLYFNKAMPLTADARLKTKIAYQIGIIHHHNRNFEAMEKTLEEAHKLGLDFPPLLNLLAYHYAKSDKHLELAHTMIEAALQTNENNPHFLDTKALILYKNKDYPNALSMLTTIAQQEPSDISILTTLSKTYYKMGNVNDAINTMEGALKVASRDCDKEQCSNLLKEWKKIHE